MYSRDGYHFTRPCRESLIQAFMHKGAWDRGYVQPASGVTIVNGDELWIYYIGFRADENNTHQHLVTSGLYRYGATGLARVRRDGFVSTEGDGMFTTRKIQFNGKATLPVNTQGTAYAELLNAEGGTSGSLRRFQR